MIGRVICDLAQKRPISAHMCGHLSLCTRAYKNLEARARIRTSGERQLHDQSDITVQQSALTNHVKIITTPPAYGGVAPYFRLALSMLIIEL